MKEEDIMNRRIIRPVFKLTMILVLVVASLSSSGCFLRNNSDSGSGSGRSLPASQNSDSSRSLPASQGIAPQSGDWQAEVITRTSDGSDKHWLIEFGINEDNHMVRYVRLLYYYGRFEDNSSVPVLLGILKSQDDVGSFAITIAEFKNGSTNSYPIKGVFTSGIRAEGTIEIGDVEYRWTATPLSE